MSLTWVEWKRHLLDHTDEQEFHCFGCNFQLSERVDHGSCTTESIIDIFDAPENGALYGFACKRCDNYVQIHNYQLVDHYSAEHEGEYSVDDAEVVTMLPDMRPQYKIILPSSLLQNPFPQRNQPEDKSLIYVPLDKQYQCGAGKCSFHGRTTVEYMEHFYKAHSVFKTFFCPHCRKIIDRKTQPTVSPKYVLDHIELHGQNIFQCFWCDFKSPVESEIRAHGLDEHFEAELKYWRNERSEIYTTQVHLTKIGFDCSICDKSNDTASSAFDHFKNEHPEYDIDFKVIEEIKTTLSDQTVKWSKHNLGEHYRQMLICGHGSCGQDFPDKHKWLEHFLRTHPSQPLAVKRDLKWLNGSKYPKMNDSSFDKDLLFFCAFCENKNDHKTQCSGTIERIYDHWKAVHVPKDMRPFRFCVADLISCYHCGLMSTFQGLQVHNDAAHPNQPFIPVKVFGKEKRCALCDYEDDNNLTEHFETKHSLAMESKVFNPIRINKHIWKELQQIFVHKKILCEYCKLVCEDVEDFQYHHDNYHRKFERKPFAFYDKNSIQLVGSCCTAKLDPSIFYDHLAYFKHTITCTKCPFTTTDGFIYVSHLVEKHHESDSISTLYRNFMTLRYWRSELIFGNGLIVNRFNIEGTKYDFSKKFDKFLDHLVIEKKKEYTTPKYSP